MRLPWPCAGAAQLRRARRRQGQCARRRCRRASPGSGCTQTEGTLFERRPRTTPDTSCATLQQPPEAVRACPAHGEHVLSHGRGIHDPSFGLLAVRTHDRVQKKPAKAEPMKDEIRLSWKRNPVKTFPMEDGIGVFGLCAFLYPKPLAKASGRCAQTIRRHHDRLCCAGRLAGHLRRHIFRAPALPHHPKLSPLDGNTGCMTNGLQ